AEGTVELTAAEFHVFGRPFQFRTRHRRIDDEFQLLRREPAQVEVQLPRVVALRIKTEPLGQRIVHHRHHFRRDLMVRPIGGRSLIVNQRVSQGQRTVFRELVGMRRIKLLEPGQCDRRKIVRLQLTEKFAQKL
ncbi:MAG: hypothetical protein ACK56I_33765, partial [bacterium]